MKIPQLFLFCALNVASFLMPALANAQKLENVLARVDGDQIFIEYDLSSDNGKDRYEISIYSSHNNFMSPLTIVQGDVGRNILPGKRRIIWSAHQELKAFSGDLTFEVRGNLLASMVVVKELPRVRRGKTATISWTGGASSESLKIDLLDKDGKLVAPIASTPNKGSYSWSVPGTSRKGNYRIQISQSGDKSFTDVTIRPKFPLLLKVGPMLVIGALIPFLIPPPDPDPLPEPPSNPNN